MLKTSVLSKQSTLDIFQYFGSIYTELGWKQVAIARHVCVCVWRVKSRLGGSCGLGGVGIAQSMTTKCQGVRQSKERELAIKVKACATKPVHRGDCYRDLSLSVCLLSLRLGLHIKTRLTLIHPFLELV